MLLDTKQLVAANHDAVVVLQLVRPGSDDEGENVDGFVLSGHVLDGRPVMLDAAGGVTANVLAGLAMGLSGRWVWLCVFERERGLG